MARRIIFLDIDGVLNNLESRQTNAAERGFDRAAIKRLNRLVRRTGAELVLSSAWRHSKETEEMQVILEGVGFAGRLVDRTPRMGERDPDVHWRVVGAHAPRAVGWPRGYEIQQWLDGHEDVEGIVILDDRDDMSHLVPWLVRTTVREGLLDVHIDAAIPLIAKPAPPSTRTPVAAPPPVRPRTRSQRFIVLDIDGVLNNARSRARIEGHWRDIDPDAMTRLNEVIERTQADVVLSSAWRKAIDIDEVQARLEDSGFRGYVVDRTPSRDEYDPAVFERLSGTTLPKTQVSSNKIGWPRGYEIQQWLDAQAKVEGVVILDERQDMDPLGPWLVATTHVEGLQTADVDRAVALLFSPPPPSLAVREG